MNDNPDVQDLICMQGNLKKSVIVQRQHKLVNRDRAKKTNLRKSTLSLPPLLLWPDHQVVGSELNKQGWIQQYNTNIHDHSLSRILF